MKVKRTKPALFGCEPCPTNLQKLCRILKVHQRLSSSREFCWEFLECLEHSLASVRVSQDSARPYWTMRGNPSLIWSEGGVVGAVSGSRFHLGSNE